MITCPKCNYQFQTEDEDRCMDCYWNVKMHCVQNGYDLRTQDIINCKDFTPDED